LRALGESEDSTRAKNRPQAKTILTTSRPPAPWKKEIDSQIGDQPQVVNFSVLKSEIKRAPLEIEIQCQSAAGQRN